MSDNTSSTARLRDEHIKVISQIAQEEEKWEVIRQEYESLKETLSTLPQKVEHKIMVPVGSVGLLPGKLIHTNEITVLLGDNWFVKRSGHQASQMVDRRLKLLHQKIEIVKKEKEFIESRKKVTEELSSLDERSEGITEISEMEAGSVMKGKGRVAHKSTHSITPRKVDISKNSSGSANFVAGELFARLDELEIEERRNEEHGMNMDDLSKDAKNRVHFVDNVDGSDVEANSVEDELDSTRENCIKFNHTSEHVVYDSSAQQDPALGPEDTNKDQQEKFKSPADIYKHFVKPAEAEEKPLKSILKKERKHSNEGLKPRPILKHSPDHKSDTPSHEDAASVSTDERRPILKSGPEAVAATVVEKTVEVPAPDVTKTVPKKPVSRFKASRMKK